MRTALFILLIVAVFVGPSMAHSDSSDEQTATAYTGDMSKYSDKYQEKSYPYEKCTDLKCSENGKVYYADGSCDQCGKKCRMFEYCSKCSMTYEVKDGKKADGICDYCGSPCYLSEKCDGCGYTHYYDGYCDKCGEPCDYNKCVENCYLKCTVYEYDISTGEKHYCDGYCDSCGKPCETYAYCPKCNEKYAADGTMSCPKEGTPLIYAEKCDKCGHTYYYDGYSDTTHQKCVFDKCCYVYCDKYCYEYSNKCLQGLCPSCGAIKKDTVYGGEMKKDTDSVKSTEKCESCAKPTVEKAMAY